MRTAMGVPLSPQPCGSLPTGLQAQRPVKIPPPPGPRVTFKSPLYSKSQKLGNYHKELISERPEREKAGSTTILILLLGQPRERTAHSWSQSPKTGQHTLPGLGDASAPSPFPVSQTLVIARRRTTILSPSLS